MQAMSAEKNVLNITSSLGHECLTEAVKLAQEMDIDFAEHGIRKCAVYLDQSEFKFTWHGNKTVYHMRMVIAAGGELIILAPSVTKFGEDTQCDKLIRKYGYRGRLHMLEKFNKPENQKLRENEKIYFISNTALRLWINREKFEN